MDILTLVINASLGIIAAVVASYITSRWALKKFYSEKWWERKERAYVEIIDSLYDIVQYLEVQKEDYGGGTGHAKEKEDELSEKHRQAYWKIKKATDIGAFVISQEANNVLKELRIRPRLKMQENARWDVYEEDYRYHKKTLDEIVRIAKEDLKRAG